MRSAPLMSRSSPDPAIPRAVHELGPWFHNLHLPDGTQTASSHPLGDFPACKWRQIGPHLPRDLRGWSVLDIGCNAGFYSIELARRGAKVAGVDREPHFLRQAQWAIGRFGLEGRIRLHRMQVYELAHIDEGYDLVLFMGVFYHLRYPSLALDIAAAKAKRLLIFQSLTLPGERVFEPEEDYDIDSRPVMLKDGWPRMAFIEKSLAGDRSNWWAPNHACIEALLRSTGMGRIRRLGHELYLCEAPRTGVDRAREWDPEEMLAATGRLGSRGTVLRTLLPGDNG